MEPHSEPAHGFDSPFVAVRLKVGRFFRKFNLMLTAMAYAEAGDLDAVKEILEQDRAQAKK